MAQRQNKIAEREVESSAKERVLSKERRRGEEERGEWGWRKKERRGWVDRLNASPKW